MKKAFSYFRVCHLVLVAGVFVLIFTIASCSKVTGTSTNEGLKPTPTNPWLPSKPYSYDSGDDNLATLGRVLFYDKNLSFDKSVSCGSCHQQAHGFADDKAFSIGFGGQPTKRNAHSLINNNNSLFWDGQINNQSFGGGYGASVSSAIIVPMQSHEELNIDENTLVDRLSALPYYQYLFRKVNNANGFVSFSKIQQALGAFTSNLAVNNSKFNQVSNGTASFSQLESDGQAIFNGKGKCNLCHWAGNAFAGNNNQFEDIGLDMNYTDIGRAGVTNQNTDRGRFHVPSLMNIALTAPYMHDGRFKTLDEVVDFFSTGVQQSPNISSAFSLHPISNGNGGYNTGGIVSHPNLTAYEKSSLVAFLNTLTETGLTTDVRYSDPFKH